MCAVLQSTPPPVKEGPYVIFLTDRRLGAPVRLASRRGVGYPPFRLPYTCGDAGSAVSFTTTDEALVWWRNLPTDCRLRRRFTMTIDRL